MKKLIDLLKNRLVISLVGVVILCVLIYFAGPKIAYGEIKPLSSSIARWVVIAVVFIAFLSIVAWQRRQAFLTNALLWTGLGTRSTSTSDQTTQDELEKIRTKQEEAFELLRKLQVKHHGSKAYARDLPWYIMIGSPASGKSTALKNAGLHFPLAEKLGTLKVKGVGGTRNVEWLITDEAVLIDTAGRFLTQDSTREIDAATWLGFLQILRKRGTEQPINGIILSVSAVDLQRLSVSERTVQTDETRLRLKELHEAFGLRLPVYVVVTKCDLLAGFSEYFSNLGREELSQVWGTTFPLDNEIGSVDPLSSLPSELLALERRIGDGMISRLREERDLFRRSLIYAFPQQFALLRTSIVDYLADVFSYAASEHIALRGVYFTSGTQEGTPLDRVMSSLARSLGLTPAVLSPHSGDGKAFFITRLFRDVIFREAGLVGKNLKVERRRAWWQVASYASVGIVALAMLCYWTISYFHDRSYLESIETAADKVAAKLNDLSSRPDHLPTLLETLDSARALPRAVGDKSRDVPHSWGLGFDQSMKIDLAASGAYTRVLNATWLRYAVHQLESDLQNERDELQLYELLKTYLILTGNAQANTIDPHFWQRYAERQNASVSADHRSSFLLHTRALLERAMPERNTTINMTLVGTVRQRLVDPEPARQLFRFLKTRPEIRALLEEKFSPTQSDALAGQVLRRKNGASIADGIPRFYSPKGYDQFKSALQNIVKMQVDDAWVLGPAITPNYSNPKALQDGVSALYYSEYIKAWKELLADYTIVSLGDPMHAVEKLALLSDKESPLRKLLVAAAEQTTLTERGKANKPATPPTPVDLEFEPLHRMVIAENGRAPIDGVLEALRNAHHAMTTIKAKIDRGDQIQPEDMQPFSTLREQAPMHPLPVRGFLETVSSDSARVLRGGNYAKFDEEWRTDVLPLCRQAIIGRYPFDDASAQDVKLADFKQMFAKGGAIDKFAMRIAPYIDKDGHHWRARGSDQYGLNISAATLATLKHAYSIQQAFFANGADVSVSFMLSPLMMDSSIRVFTLDWGDVDTRLTFEIGKPRLRRNVVWPASKSRDVARVEVSPAGPQGGGISKAGSWALWKLLATANIKKIDGRNEYNAQFSIDGRHVHLVLEPDSAINPFSITSLGAFRCPEHL